MLLFLSIVACTLFILLVVISALRPTHASLSLFELRRRKEAKDGKASEELKREQLLAQLGVAAAPAKALIIVALSFLLIHILGWERGAVAALSMGLIHTRIAHFPPVGRLANKLYRRYEDRLLGLALKYETIIRLVGGKASLKEKRITFGSHEELSHALEASPIFSDRDRQLLKSALRFKTRLVKNNMTPKSAIVSVKQSELLGPLVLDDLHKTGHTIFPVLKGKEIVGLLDSSDHIALRSKESVHVRDVMRADVAKISESATLDEALETLVESRQPMLVVVDDDQTAGIITLGDITRALLGR